MPALTGAAPVVFVLLWSSAFVGAKFGLPYAEPLTFMWLRFTWVTAMFLALSLIFRVPWPDSLVAVGHLAVVGLLVQGLYLSGTFIAIARGASVGLVALVLGLQPVLTVLFASVVMRSRITRLQWIGVMAGFAGLVLVLWNQLDLGSVNTLDIVPVGVGLLCMTAGTLYQRHHCARMNILTGNVVQSVTAMAVTGLGALAFEDMDVEWTPKFAGALTWMVLVVSLGAYSLFLYMLRQNQATRVSSLFYLTPPVAAIMAYFMFGEVLTTLSLAGFAVAVVGVALVVRGDTT